MKLLLITLALLLASTSAMRIKQDDTCETDEITFEEDGVSCSADVEYCPDGDTVSYECPGLNFGSG